MLRARWLVGSLIVLGLVALAAFPVYARGEKEAARCRQMVRMMEAGKMSLAKAIALAEKESQGRALAAYCRLQKNRLQIQVYCLVRDKIMQVEIDARTGQVTEMERAESLPGQKDQRRPGDDHEEDEGSEEDHDEDEEEAADEEEDVEADQDDEREDDEEENEEEDY